MRVRCTTHGGLVPPSPLPAGFTAFYCTTGRVKRKKYGLSHNGRDTYTNPEKVIFRSYTNPYILHPKYLPREELLEEASRPGGNGSIPHPEKWVNALRLGS